MTRFSFLLLWALMFVLSACAVQPKEADDDKVLVTSVKLNGDAAPTVIHRWVPRLTMLERLNGVKPYGEIGSIEQPIYNYDGNEFCPTDSMILYTEVNYGSSVTEFSCYWGTGSTALDTYTAGACVWSHDSSYVSEDNPTGAYCSGPWKGRINSFKNNSYYTCKFTTSRWLGFPYYRYASYTINSGWVNSDTSTSDIKNSTKLECW